MTRKITFALTAFVLALAIGVTAAFAGTTRSSADPGVTPTSILLGTTSPLSGVASAYASVARGADAYFKYVNARGGANAACRRSEFATDLSASRSGGTRTNDSAAIASGRRSRLTS